MDCTDLGLGGPRLVVPDRFGDSRGWFSETYNQQRLLGLGIDTVFVQDNQSHSRDAGTVRGLHFQRPPFAQAKLVRVARGRILDVVVDVRRGSPWYGRWVSAELSAENGCQLLAPVGFLHGFVTREPGTDVIYKVSNYYSREHDGAVLWNDPDLAIDWSIGAGDARLSDKDAAAERFATFASPFVYEG
jgi:dTDP-4-dehydrorhamnose 3,5-epimerase